MKYGIGTEIWNRDIYDGIQFGTKLFSLCYQTIFLQVPADTGQLQVPVQVVQNEFMKYL